MPQLGYLTTAPLESMHEAMLERLITEEPVCVYQWQNYHLWLLAVRQGFQTVKLREAAHAIVANRPSEPEVAVAALYLGHFGDYTDRRALLRAYSEAWPYTTKRTFCIALQGLHPSDRAGFYADRETESEPLRVLVSYLRGKRHDEYLPPPRKISTRNLAHHLPGEIS